MLRIMVLALINMFLGLVVGKALSVYPEDLSLVVSVTILVGLVLSAILWRLMSPSKKEPKKAINELKEGEVYSLLRSCNAREAGARGVVAMVRSSKTHELKMLIFEEDPPQQFKKEDGKIVSYP